MMQNRNAMKHNKIIGRKRKMTEYLTKAKTGRPNHVAMSVDDKGLLLWAEHTGKRIRKRELMLFFEGGMSKEQAIRSLQLVIGHLQKEGLPRKPDSDFVHMELLTMRKKHSAATIDAPTL
jgi:hypothetical protein